jgi:hypothetical protein
MIRQILIYFLLLLFLLVLFFSLLFSFISLSLSLPTTTCRQYSNFLDVTVSKQCSDPRTVARPQGLRGIKLLTVLACPDVLAVFPNVPQFSRHLICFSGHIAYHTNKPPLVAVTKLHASRSQKNYNVATRTAEPRRVKTRRNSQRSKASNAVLLTYSRAMGRGSSSCLFV